MTGHKQDPLETEPMPEEMKATYEIDYSEMDAANERRKEDE
eukprot:CAMPEP_0114012426 /NCGR_PEP_ID=MMETSP0372-20130328/9419_1 /TAXON_ID=340204 /ORGANISM="Lankesteria abbotti" /LENGTH=40 /assembly_acc=CAM_ASM_000359